MRIAFTPAARVLSDREPNGEALIAEALLRRLADRGHEIVAYCERAGLAREIPGVEVVEVNCDAPSAAQSRLRFAKRIARDAAGRSFDIAHLLFPLSTREGYALVRGVPLIAGPMFVSWPDAVARPRRPLARAAGTVFDRVESSLHRRTFARAKGLLVTGSRARADLPPGLRGRVVEVPIGIDTDRFALRAAPAEPTILFLSVLQARKGIEILLDAMPMVATQIPRARLIVAGPDPFGMLPALRARATSLGVADRVEFSGEVSPFDAPEVHARAQVFCQPSLGEPYGMTVLEAMATGRPVVSTAAGGVTDLVVDGRGGRLAPAGDARLLADALVDVLRDPARAREMGAHNRARAERMFSLDRVTDLVEHTYETVLEAQRGPIHAA